MAWREEVTDAPFDQIRQSDVSSSEKAQNDEVFDEFNREDGFNNLMTAEWMFISWFDSA